jgi:hypothetical protein
MRFGRVGFIAVAGCVIATWGVAFPAAAAASPSTLVQESFTSSTTTSPNWVLPAASGAVAANDACLTGSDNTSQTPIPGCTVSGSVPGLQLTINDLSQEGGLAYGLSVPTSQGLDVTFDSNQYAGGGADGVAFFLAGSDPANPSSSPVTLGPPGGALGYFADPSNDNDGLTNAYLGVGLDAFGNFTNPQGGDFGNPTSQGGCGESPQQQPERLDVRGPGSGQHGYCLLNTVQTGGLHTSEGAPTTPVEVAINPSDAPITTPGGLSVPSDGYAASVTDTAGHTETASGLLPDASGFLPDGWLDSSGVPKQLTFGWSASTGAVQDYHTISNVSVDSLIGTPPQLGVTLTDNSGGNAHSGQTVVYTAVTKVTAADETKPITLTDTFPSDLVPQTTGLGGDGWTCDVDGQTVTCTSATPVAAGDSLSVAMPVLVSIPNGSAPMSTPDTVTVSSDDANPSNDADTETYAAAPSATVLAFVNQPVSSQVNQPMLNTDGTPTHVRVAAEITPTGPVDTNYSGTVTLAFQNNPGSAKFVVNGSPSTTLTAQASHGVADFSPVVINAVGFGDTLRATATGLTAAVSTAFDVNSAETVCISGKACSTTTTSAGTGQAATVTEAAGQGNSLVTATFGGNVAPLHPCNSAAPGILTFSGARQKTITLTITTKQPILLFCYGQPTPFIDLFLHKTTFFNPVNQDFEGLLPPCLPKLNGPCINQLILSKTSETVKILSGAADPHISH